jgi:hypothetical protein
MPLIVPTPKPHPPGPLDLAPLSFETPHVLLSVTSASLVRSSRYLATRRPRADCVSEKAGVGDEGGVECGDCDGDTSGDAG